MIKTLTKHGNSMALLIDKPIMELLNITPKTPLNITTDGEVLVVSPVHDPKRNKKFKSALDKINKQYPKTLQKLAN